MCRKIRYDKESCKVLSFLVYLNKSLNLSPVSGQSPILYVFLRPYRPSLQGRRHAAMFIRLMMMMMMMT